VKHYEQQMRIVKIEFKNITPLAGEHVINIDYSISQKAFLYAVTGKSEAERSAVITALCAALYGRTNDLEGSDLLYHNSKEAYSKVTFELTDKSEYQAFWTIHKRNNKYEIIWQLKQLLPKQMQWQGEKEVQESLKSLLKLNVKQFLSSVILMPQICSELLSATSEERPLLLEKITGTDIYAKMSKAIFLKRVEYKEKYEKLLSEINGISKNKLTDETLKQIKESLILENSKQSRDKQALEQKEKYLEWMRRYVSVKTQQRAVLKIQQEAQSAYNMLYDQKIQLDRYDSVQPFHSLYDRIVEKKKAIESMRAEISNLQQKRHECKEILLQLKKEHTEAGANLEACNIDYTKNIPFIRQGRHIEAEVNIYTTQLKQYNNLAKQLQEDIENYQLQFKSKQEKQEKCLKIQQQLQYGLQAIAVHRPMIEKIDEVKEYIEKIRDSYANTQECSQKLIELQKSRQQDKSHKEILETQQNELLSRISSLKGELNIHLQAIQGLSSVNLQQRIIHFSDLQRDSQTARDLWINIANDYENQDHCSNEIRRLAADLKKIDTEIPHINLHLLEKQKRFEIAQKASLLSQHKNLLDIRKQLQEGLPCPVCGGTHHPYNAQELGNLINNLNQDLEEAKAEYDGVQKQLDEILQQKRCKQLLLDENQKMLKKIKQHLTERIAHWQRYIYLDPSFSDTSTSVSRTNRTMLLTHLFDNATRELDNEKKLNEEYNQHQQAINEINESIQAINNELSDVNKKVTELSVHTKVQDSITQELESKIKTNDNKVAAVLSQMEPIITISLWKEKYKTQYESFIQEISDIVHSWKNFHLKMEENKQEMVRLQTDISIIEASLKYSQQHLSDIMSIVMNLTNKVKTGQANIKKLFNDLSVDEAEDAFAKNLSDAKERERKVYERYSAKDKEFNDIVSQITSMQYLQQKTEKELHDISTELDVCISRFNLENPPLQYFELEKLFSDTCDWNKLRRNLEQKKSTLDKANYEMANIDAHILELMQSEDKPQEEYLDNEVSYQREKNQLTEAITIRDKKIENLQFILDKHNDCMEKLAAYDAEKAEMEATLNKWDKLNNLIGSVDGTKFRQIAQTHVLELLIKSANAQLRRLDSRYLLCAEHPAFEITAIDTWRMNTRCHICALSSDEKVLISIGLSMGVAAILRGDSNLTDIFICSQNLEKNNVAIDALNHYCLTQQSRIGILDLTKHARQRIQTTVQI